MWITKSLLLLGQALTNPNHRSGSRRHRKEGALSPQNDENKDVLVETMSFGVRQTWVSPHFTTYQLCGFRKHI